MGNKKNSNSSHSHSIMAEPISATVKPPRISTRDHTLAPRIFSHDVLFLPCFYIQCVTFQMIVFHEARGPFVEEFYQCVTHGSYSEKWQEQLYTSLSLLFMFILPLIILMSTYAATFVTISSEIYF